MVHLLFKEFATFFAAPIGYIVVGIFLLMTSLFLWVIPGDFNIIYGGYANLDGLFMIAPLMYLFLVPAITMRLFAEEKKTGTMELLLTHPIKKIEIVTAKYLSGVLLVLFSLLPTLVYVFALWVLADPSGNIDTGGIWGSYIGLFFLALVYVAIGVFASSLTDNQIISFILAAVLCFVFYYGFDMLSSMSTDGNTQTFVSSLGINSHYESMSRGVIDSRDVLYFISVCFIFIYVTNLVISKKK